MTPLYQRPPLKVARLFYKRSTPDPTHWPEEFHGDPPARTLLPPCACWLSVCLSQSVMAPESAGLRTPAGRSQRHSTAVLPRGAAAWTLPNGVLHSLCYDARRDRGGLALPLPPALRPAQLSARARWHGPDRLARRSALGDAVDHPHGDLEELRLQHVDLHRRAAEHSRRALRGSPHRWGRCTAPLPPRHDSPARADLSLRRRRDDDRLLPALRRAVRDDRRRPAASDDEPRALHV